MLVLSACELGPKYKYKLLPDGTIRDKSSRLVLGLRDNGLRAVDPVHYRCPKIGTYHGERSDIYGRVGVHPTAGRHAGIDIPVPRGTDVLAPADGVVERTYVSEFTGDTNLDIRHPAPKGAFGVERPVVSRFAHLISSTITVRAGQQVKRGQRLAAVEYHGREAKNITHLHWEIVGLSSLRGAGPIRQYNPLTLMNPEIREAGTGTGRPGRRLVPLRSYVPGQRYERFRAMSYPLRCRVIER